MTVPERRRRATTGVELSRSTPVANPATVGDSAVDLDRLLAASGEPGPYVLVGHSLGGPIVRLYAAAHPAEVAGLVFDDALSEDLGDGLTPAQMQSFEQLNDPVSQGRPPGSENAFYSSAVVPLLRAAPPGPQVPTVILSADQWPYTAEAVEAAQASGEPPRSSRWRSPTRSGRPSSRPRTPSPRSIPAPRTSPRPTQVTTSTSTIPGSWSARSRTWSIRCGPNCPGDTLRSMASRDFSSRSLDLRLGSNPYGWVHGRSHDL